MRGLCEPRSHADVDLLYPGEDFAAVERLLGESELKEIEGKRFPHKRAFLFEAVMVEAFLTSSSALPVASASALAT